MILAPGVSFGLTLASAVAVCGYALAVVRAREVQEEGAWMRWVLLIGWLAHGIALWLEVGQSASQGQARFGFAAALSATAWLVLAVYAVESRFVPLPGVRRGLALVGLAAVLLALVFPGAVRPGAASAWSPLHWILGIASYGLFGAAVLHAVLMSAAERHLRPRGGHPAVPSAFGLPLLTLEKLTFRFVQAGFVLLTATLLLGWWTTGPWRWDHKTVLSVLAWVVFAGLLIGRQTLGWRGRRAARWLYTGAALLLLAYVGSRFVRDVVLR